MHACLLKSGERIMKIAIKNGFKLLSLASGVSLFAGCGSGGGNGPSAEELANNNAPTAEPLSIVVTDQVDSVTMSVIPGTVNLLSSAGDVDVGDTLRVVTGSIRTNAPAEDVIGVTLDGLDFTVDPAVYAPNINIGDVITFQYTYDITDGLATVTNTIDVTINGFDVAPESPDISVSFPENRPDITVDLLQGVIDGDGDTVEVKNVVEDASNPENVISVAGSILTFDVSSISAGLVGGATQTFIVNYELFDGNNTVPKSATVIISGVAAGQEPPFVNSAQEASFNTGDNQITVDLSAAPAIIEPNGDPMIVDFASIEPVGDAPAFKFALSEGNNLVIDPIEFYTHVPEGGSEVFEYTYDIADDKGASSEATFKLTISQSELPNLVQNPGFEADEPLQNWVEVGSEVSTQAADQPEFSGVTAVSFASTDGGVSQVIGGLEAGSQYIFEGRQRRGAFSSGLPAILDDMGSTLFAGEWFYQSGDGAQLFALHFTPENVSAVRFVSGGNVTADNFGVSKYPTEAANNLIPADASNFDNGAADWALGTGASVSADNAIGGAGSSFNSGIGNDVNHSLALGTGVLEDGKRYLITMDVSIDEYDSTANRQISVSLQDFDDGFVTTYGPDSGERVYRLSDTATQRFAVLIDMNDSDRAGWASRNVHLVIGTNTYNNAKNHRIDNISMVEIP